MTKKTVDQFRDAMWRAVEEMWTDMYVSDMDAPEIKALMVRDVKIYCDEMKRFAQKDLHGMSAKKRRALR
jgi:hypothetical protein